MQRPIHFKNYEFTIKTIFFFDPSQKPASKKPSEEEIQDAKLLYYYPENASIH